jgi:hypothetical protein
MTPRSSCPGGESTPLRGATSGSHYEINNVTETAVGISRGRHPERGYGLSYSPPGSFLESTGGSVLTRAEDHAKVDPKVSADQRGHGIGVALDVYTKSSIADRAAAAKQLEESVLTSGVRARKRPA